MSFLIYPSKEQKVNITGVVVLKIHRWDKINTELLIKNYPIKTMDELKVIFPNFTEEQIRRKAKYLKLKKEEELLKKIKADTLNDAKRKGKDEHWSDEDIEILKKYYGTEGAEGVKQLLTTQHELRAIVKKANSLSLYREKKSLMWKQSEVSFEDNGLFSITIKYKGF